MPQFPELTLSDICISLNTLQRVSFYAQNNSEIMNCFIIVNGLITIPKGTPHPRL